MALERENLAATPAGVEPHLVSPEGREIGS
jgi:hypothetical protein